MPSVNVVGNLPRTSPGCCLLGVSLSRLEILPLRNGVASSKNYKIMWSPNGIFRQAPCSRVQTAQWNTLYLPCMASSHTRPTVTGTSGWRWLGRTTACSFDGPDHSRLTTVPVSPWRPWCCDLHPSLQGCYQGLRRCKRGYL